MRKRCPVRDCRGFKLTGGDLCAECQRRWEDAQAFLARYQKPKDEAEPFDAKAAAAGKDAE